MYASTKKIYMFFGENSQIPNCSATWLNFSSKFYEPPERLSSCRIEEQEPEEIAMNVLYPENEMNVKPDTTIPEIISPQ